MTEYRETIRHLVTAEDTVLELGCEWGTTTRRLAEAAGQVIGTDVSPDCIRRAPEQNPEIRFEVLDAFDVRAALELGAFTVVYVDLSGHPDTGRSLTRSRWFRCTPESCGPG